MWDLILHLFIFSILFKDYCNDKPPDYCVFLWKISDSRHLKPSCHSLSLEILFQFLEYWFAEDNLFLSKPAWYKKAFFSLIYSFSIRSYIFCFSVKVTKNNLLNFFGKNLYCCTLGEHVIQLKFMLKAVIIVEF